MLVVSSFERVYRYDDAEFHVLFEGKSQTSKTLVSNWHLTIRPSRGGSTIRYIFSQDGLQWVKSVGINNFPIEIERTFLAWAVAELAADLRMEGY